MSEQKPPKIEFPCVNYPIKVMGDAGAELHTLVIEVMARHDSDFDSACVLVRDSSKGKFQSVNVCITATGVDQLQCIFEDLKKNPIVKMVL